MFFRLALCVLLLAPSWLKAETAPEWSLPDIVHMALQRSEALVAARLRIEEKSEWISQAGALPNPELEGLLGRKRDPLAKGNVRDFGLSQELGFFAVRGLRRSVARLDLEEEKERFVLLKGQVALEVGQAALEVNLWDQLLKFFEDRSRRLKLVHDFLGGRPFVSPQQRAEREVVTLHLAQLEGQAMSGEALRGQAWTTLALHTGLEDGSRTRITIPRRVDDPDPGLESLLKGAPSTNPEVLARKAAVARAFKERALARWEIWSGLSFRAGLALEAASAEEKTWTAGLSMPLPLFNRNGGASRALEFRSRAEESDLAFETRRVATAAENLTRRLGLARSRARLYPANSLELWEAELSRAESGFRKGQLELLSFLELDSQVAESYREALETQSDLARIGLEIRLLAGDPENHAD